MKVLIFLVLLIAPFALWAQETGTVVSQEEFDQALSNWDRTAQQTELLLDSEDAADLQLENFRRALDQNRNQANYYISVTSSQVSDLEDQLQALTPSAPAGSDSDSASSDTETQESDELKARRADVQTRLADLQGNVLSANQVIKEANGLIDQINARLRQNYYSALLTRNASPLNWNSVQLGAYTLVEIYDSVTGEIISNFQKVSSSGVISEKWPTAFIFIILGIFFLIWSPRLVYLQIHQQGQWTGRIQRLAMPWASTFVALIAMPTALDLIFYGIELTELLGHDGLLLLQSVRIWCYFLLAAAWFRWTLVCGQDEEALGKGFTWSLYTLALVSGMDWTLVELTRIADIDQQGSDTLHFVFIAFGTLSTWYLTTPKRYAALFGATQLETYPWFKEIMRRVLRFGVIFAFFLSIVGYFAASYQMFRGIVITSFVTFAGIHFYRILTGWIAQLLAELGIQNEGEIDTNNPGAGDHLWPILIQIGIWLIGLPVALLAWGVPESTLIELWNRAKNGVSLGDMQLSLTSIFKMLLVFYLGFLLVNALKNILDKSVLTRTKLDVGARSAIVALSGYLGYTLVAIFAMTSAGLDLSAIGYIAGALSVGIGFGLQNIVQNFISGIILLIERPIKKGDWIKVNNSEGYVQNIAVRSTSIRTFDDSTIIVPNADLITSPVTNWFLDDQSARVVVPVGVSYDADPDYVEQVLLETVEESTYKRRDPNPSVVIRELGASSVHYELRYWINDADWITRARSETFVSILKRFRKEGIVIPFPQSEVRVLNYDDDRSN